MTNQRRVRAVGAALIIIPCLLLALIGSGPAGAANTASELLVDRSDSDSAPIRNGVRPFAGRDRYETAVLLAERYAHQRGGLGSVSTAILVSGESPADGLVAAALAGRLQAPILLTAPDSLPGDVARFLDRHDVATVIAVGGSSAIADTELARIGALQAMPEVLRVEGEDRFETAAAVASQLDGQSAWCGVNGTAALVVNGSDEHTAALAGLGTLAFAREMPVLLTRSAELPVAAAQYLRRARIERVVVAGDASAVSDAVVSAILAQGVDDVTRVAAASTERIGTAIAELLTVTCRHELNPSPSIVALAGPRASIDATAAAPLLATGLDGSGPVPLVLARSTLSPSARSFLARTPREIDGHKNHVLIAAIGGHRAVSEATMDAAVTAAASARALTARISAAAGDKTLRIAFSESLKVDGARFIGRLRDELYVNDAPAWIVGQPTLGGGTADPCQTLSTADVTLNDELKPGDVIELGTIDDWYSTNGDRRDIAGAAVTIAEPRPLSGSPRIEIIAQPRASTLWVSVSSNAFLDPATGADAGISVNSGRVRVFADDGTAVAVGRPRRVRLDRFLGTALYAFELRSNGSAYELAERDRVVARSGLAASENGQRSRSRGVTVTEPAARLNVVSVRVGPPNPGVDDSTRTKRPEEVASLSRPARASLGASLSVKSKWSGAAAGAAGNGWTIYSIRSDTAAGTLGDEPPPTQVWVDTRHRSITVRHIEAPDGEERDQTYGDLAQLLNADRNFATHFTAELTEPCAGDEILVNLDEPGLTGNTAFGGGISSVSFLVTFNDYVREYVSDGVTLLHAGPVGELVDDILGGLISDYGQTAVGIAADRVEVAAPVPGTEVIFRFITEDPDHTIAQQINLRGKRIDIREGIAIGFRSDDLTTASDESVNGARALFAVASRDSRLLRDLP